MEKALEDFPLNFFPSDFSKLSLDELDNYLKIGWFFLILLITYQIFL